MIGAMCSESLKLWQKTTVAVVLAMAAFMAVTMIISVPGAEDQIQDRGPAGRILPQAQLEAADGLAQSLGNGIVFLGVAVLVLVAMNVGNEYVYGTIRNILIRRPDRVTIASGKAIVLAITVSVAVTVASLVGILSGFLLALGEQVDTSNWTSADGVLAIVGGVANLVIATCGWAAIGYVIAIVLRSAAQAIAVGVAYMLPVEIILVELLGAYARWLPGQIFQSLARGGDEAMTYWLAIASTLLIITVCTVTAVFVFKFRDVDE